jgi:ketosteroid isomerase-like protein
MSNQNVDLIHAAYDALARGDLETMLSFVDEDLVWTYLESERRGRRSSGLSRQAPAREHVAALG